MSQFPLENESEVVICSRFKDLVQEFDQHVLHLSEEPAIKLVGLTHTPMEQWDIEQALQTLVEAFESECKHVIMTSEKERHEYVKKQLRRGGGGTMFKAISVQDT